jgi:ABC-type arginine transport system ATPase subunit
MPDILDVRGLNAFYGSFQALFDVSLNVAVPLSAATTR